MKNPIKQCTSLIILFVGSVAALANASEQFESVESANLADYEKLVMNVSHSQLEIVDGNSNDLTATLTQTLYSGDQQECLMKLVTERKGSTLELRTEKSQISWNNHCEVRRKLLVSMDQKALQKLEVELRHGNFETLSLIVPEQSLRIAHGNIKVADVSASRWAINLSHGNGDFGTIASPQADMNGAHGGVKINSFSGERLNGKWAHGSVKLTELNVNKLKFEQAHGAFKVTKHHGDQLAIKNAHGPINLQASDAQSVELKNSHGEIYYAGNSDSLRVNNSHGDVNLIQRNADFKEISGSASHGDIHLKVPQASVCNFQVPQVNRLKSSIMKSAKDCDIAAGGELKLQGGHSDATVTSL